MKRQDITPFLLYPALISLLIGTAGLHKPQQIPVGPRPEGVPVVIEMKEPQTEAQEPESLGEYRLTAYCGCAKCCGTWAKNRPLDEQGREIVLTASGYRAEQGVTIAAPKEIPFGTELEINGHTYTVQDRGSAIVDKNIDIYFEAHADAERFGAQYAEIIIKH